MYREGDVAKTLGLEDSKAGFEILWREVVFPEELSGAGIKGKVIEALSYGVPSVLTPIAAEGTGIRDGYEALIRENPKEFAEAVCELYTNKELWERISKNAIDFVRKEYSFEKAQELVRKALEMVDVYVPENVDSLYCKGCRG